MEKNTGKVREFCQSGKVGTLDLYWVAGKILRFFHFRIRFCLL